MSELSIEQRIAQSTQDAPPPEAEAVVEKAQEAVAQEEDASSGESSTETVAVTGDGGEGSTDVSADTDDVDTVEVSSLSELMEHFEVAPEDVYNLTVPIADGSSSVNVSLSEMKDSFVSRQEAKRLQEEATTLRDSLKEQQTQANAQVQEYLAQSGALVEHLEKQMLAAYEGVDLNELKQNDPGQWAAMTTEIRQAQDTINQVKAKVREDIADFKARQTAEQQEALKAHLAVEQEALVKAWPEMGDPKKAESERKALVGELKARGYTEQEIGKAYDHRTLLMARDAMRWRESQAKANLAKKKVLKIGTKTLKPGAKQGKADQLQDRTQGLRKNLKKSGRVEDAAALISALEQG